MNKPKTRLRRLYRLIRRVRDEITVEINREFVRQMSGVTFYHGGAAGRAVGDILLPAGETGSDPRGEGETVPERLENVFFSPDKSQADYYARNFPESGAVYVVEPLGDVSIDPFEIRMLIMMRDVKGLDPDSLSLSVFQFFCAPRAKVLDVLPVTPEAKQFSVESLMAAREAMVRC